MKILIAEDEPVTREWLAELLQRWGYETVIANDGVAAWELLRREAAPTIVLADVQMPGMTGVELCRLAREQLRDRGLYIVLLTAIRVTRADLVGGLLSGADDYLLKPCDTAQLQARLKVGKRVVGLQSDLRHRVNELEEALSRIKQLQGLLPICCYCKKIRDDQNYWHQVETYVQSRSEATFTHGICPACLEEQMASLKNPSDPASS